MAYILTYDLGTGGLKTGLFHTDGTSAGFLVSVYPTYYPQSGWHEQRPQDWWKAVCDSTREIIQTNGIDPQEIKAVSSSGHSLVATPLDVDGNLLLDQVPIWSRQAFQPGSASFF